MRSASTSRLAVPHVKLLTVGVRAFLAAASQIYNGLREEVISANFAATLNA